MGREIGREPVFGLRPGFRRIRSEDEFHPDEITEAAPAKEEKKTGAASAFVRGRAARTKTVSTDGPPIAPAPAVSTTAHPMS